MTTPRLTAEQRAQQREQGRAEMVAFIAAKPKATARKKITIRSRDWIERDRAGRELLGLPLIDEETGESK